MDNCIFCKIANGEAPSKKIYEDDFTLCFMDISCDVDCHLLVIPKKHVKNILDCDETTLNHVMQTVKKVSNYLTEKCGYQGVNLLNASDECAGQSVYHFHVHIIPKKNNDQIDSWPKFTGAKLSIDENYELLTKNK